MTQPQGIGRPGPNQPDFEAQPAFSPPPAFPGQPSADTHGPVGNGAGPRLPWAAFPNADPNPNPPGYLTPGPRVPPAPSAGASWAPPGQVAGGPGSWSPPPSGRPRHGLAVVGFAVALALVGGAVGWYGAWRSNSQGPPPASPSASASRMGTPLPSVTRSGRATPQASTSALTGGDVGRTIPFKGLRGSGTVTVTAAHWTNSGLMEPGPGLSYLVLDLRVTATSGSVTTGIAWCRVVDQKGTAVGFSFGPQTEDPLYTRFLSSGQSTRGQIGFRLAQGPVTFEILDEELRPVAKVALL